MSVQLRHFFLYTLLILSFTSLRGQIVMEEGLFTDDYTINPGKEKMIGLSIDNINFFKNNESDGDIVPGYSVPGFRIAPRIIYHPVSFVKLEAGVSLLKYWGAEKYPNYAYRDISEWKSNHYQWGFHFLPFFRAQIEPIPQVNVILGNIYGGDNHRLIETLYNRELNMTADPEVGAQVLFDSRIAHLDAWVNWESFTFKNDTHNEAFSAGGSALLHITDPQSSFYFGIPLQGVVIHRGGEIDAVSGELLTLANGAAGMCWKLTTDHSFFRNISAEVFGVGYKSYLSTYQSIPYEKGWGFHSKLSFQLWNVNLKMLLWRSGNFINLLGNPIFGCMSMVHEDRAFSQVTVFNPGLHYEQKFGSGCCLGADFDCFYNPNFRQYRNSNQNLIKSGFSYSWSMGIYLRVNPSIIL